MKRLTKQERTGAIAVALIALGVCGGSLLIGKMQRSQKIDPELIKTIVLARDSIDRMTVTTDDDSLQSKEKNKKRGKKDSKKKGTTSGKQNGKVQKSEKKKQPPRDPLSEPINLDKK